MEGVAVDHLPVAQREDLHHGTVTFGGQTDHVDRSHRAPIGSLALCEMLNAPQTVPVPGRLLEALLRGGLLHLALELALDRLGVPREKRDHLLDDRPVVLLRDIADAGRETAIDVVFKSQRGDGQSLFLDGAHEIDAATRTIILVAGGHISRTGFQTEPAVNTGEDFFFFG